MNFVSVSFLLFFLLLLALLKVTPSKTAQQGILLAASYLFYAAFDFRFLFLLLFLSLVAWYAGRAILDKRESGAPFRVITALSIAAAVAVLGVFKYLNFFVDSFCTAFGLSPIRLAILLPVGISFYVFQMISYIADVSCGRIVTKYSLLQVLLYIGFFPNIVSGPIQKAHEFLPQLEKPVAITSDSLSRGACRFLVGMIKKVVIADRLSICVEAVFAAPMAYSGLSLLFAAIGFVLQIYCDFSGYSDMAIGIGACMHFDLGRNFNMPYLARNPSDFWRRWHISLSSWFRDYVYIPLGGSRKGEWRTCCNLFITMLLSGLWHGANWTFVIWGALHGIWSAAHKWYRKRVKGPGSESSLANGCCTLLFFCTILFLWIIFKANSMEQAWIYITRILTMAEGIAYYYVFVPIYAALVLGIQIYAAKKNGGNDPFVPLNLRTFRGKLLFCMGCLLVLLFGYFGNSAFIYAQF